MAWINLNELHFLFHADERTKCHLSAAKVREALWRFKSAQDLNLHLLALQIESRGKAAVKSIYVELALLPESIWVLHNLMVSVITPNLFLRK